MNAVTTNSASQAFRFSLWTLLRIAVGVALSLGWVVFRITRYGPSRYAFSKNRWLPRFKHRRPSPSRVRSQSKRIRYGHGLDRVWVIWLRPQRREPGSAPEQLRMLIVVDGLGPGGHGESVVPSAYGPASRHPGPWSAAPRRVCSEIRWGTTQGPCNRVIEIRFSNRSESEGAAQAERGHPSDGLSGATNPAPDSFPANGRYPTQLEDEGASR
jgi:hypothetical protein